MLDMHRLTMANQSCSSASVYNEFNARGGIDYGIHYGIGLGRHTKGVTDALHRS